MAPLTALAAWLGWAAFTPEGNATVAPWLAAGLGRWGTPADCDHPWAAWAGVLRGERVASSLQGCLANVLAPGPRRAATIRLATGPDTPPALRARAADLVLADPTQDPAAVEATLLARGFSGRARGRLLTVHRLAWSSLDLGAWAERAPPGGLYDRALLLREPDTPEARGVPEAELDTTERVWRSATPEGPPDDRAPPDATGVLALVAEADRAHVAAEWAALVRFVREGPSPEVRTRPAERWRLAAEAEHDADAPATSVHAVLRGAPAAPALAAWVLARLAEEAGLAPEVYHHGADRSLRVGDETLRLSRCGARFAAPARGGVRLEPDASAAEASAVVVAARLRAGESPPDIRGPWPAALTADRKSVV